MGNATTSSSFPLPLSPDDPFLAISVEVGGGGGRKEGKIILICNPLMGLATGMPPSSIWGLSRVEC